MDVMQFSKKLQERLPVGVLVEVVDVSEGVVRFISGYANDTSKRTISQPIGGYSLARHLIGDSFIEQDLLSVITGHLMPVRLDEVPGPAQPEAPPAGSNLPNPSVPQPHPNPEGPLPFSRNNQTLAEAQAEVDSRLSPDVPTAIADEPVRLSRIRRKREQAPE